MAALAEVDVVGSTVPSALTTTTPPDSCTGLRPKFVRDGFVILEGVLPAATIRLLNERLEAVLRGTYDTGRKPDKVPRFKVEERCKPGKKPPPIGGPAKRTLQVINVWKADAAFRSVVLDPALGKAVAELSGWDKDGARVANDQVWAKPPGASALTFHRDSAYFDFNPEEVTTVWLALDDMDEDVGPLVYVPKSHEWGEGRVGSAQSFFDKSHKDLLFS